MTVLGTSGVEEKRGTRPASGCSDEQAGTVTASTTSDGDSSCITDKRETWTSRFDFILSCVGFAVGLGNVWRFPYLCYKNGGGSFFIPYLFCLLIGGVPMFFLEVAIGQFMSKGGLAAWDICPIFKGIGYATTVIVFLMNIYYIVVLAWDLMYLAMSFQEELPWANCNNPWNTPSCRTSFQTMSSSNESAALNMTVGCAIGNETCALLNSAVDEVSRTVDPVVEFWEKRVLQISEGIDSPDGLVWELALALLVVWLLVYFCVWKGVKWAGKVVYFTATFPYLVLFILFIRGITLPGAAQGIIFYLKPDFSMLFKAQVWLDAGTQIFFSYAIGLGAMIALGSYNKFNNNCYRDCVLISSINSMTSVFAGFVIFSILGFMAHEQGVDIHQVAVKGPGLAFIAYPKAVTQMPVPQLWAVLFFFMIILVGLDSQFVGVEAFTTVMLDMFPMLRKGIRRELSIATYCLVSYLLGLTMVTRGGMYVFQLFDYYSASGMALLWVCFFECVAIAWVYGVRRFFDNLEMMLGFRPSSFLMACWLVATPIISGGIFVWMWAEFELLTYNGTYVYPAWAQTFGLCLAFSSMICIPVYFVFRFMTSPGNTLKEKWVASTLPILRPERIPDKWPDYSTLVDHAFNSQRGLGLPLCVSNTRKEAVPKNEKEIQLALMAKHSSLNQPVDGTAPIYKGQMPPKFDPTFQQSANGIGN